MSPVAVTGTRELEELTGGGASTPGTGGVPYRRVKMGKEGPPKPGELHTRSGQTRDADFEKKHPRTAKGRTGGGRFLQKNDTGGAVNTVQTKLGIKSTGKMDVTTVAAIRRFQARHGLKVDGIIGHQTISAMRGDKDAANIPIGPLTAEDKTWLNRLGVRQKGKRGNEPKDQRTPREKRVDRRLARSQRREIRDIAGEVQEASLVEHAREELKRAGLFDGDSDYDGMLGPAVMKVVEAFSGQGHSGTSAAISLALIEKLLRYEPLTPLTPEPSEWTDCSEMSGEPLWQSKRDPRAFSKDGGKTWELLEATLQLAHALLSIEEAEKHHKLKCPKCNTVQSASNKTCTKCSHNLSGARKAKFANLDEAVEIRRVRGHAVRARELEVPELAEALMDGARELEELRSAFDAKLHPRDREGQFRDVLGNLQRYIDVAQDLDAVDSAIRAIPEIPKMPREEHERRNRAREDYWKKYGAVKEEVTAEFERSLRERGSHQSIYDRSVEDNIRRAADARAKEAGLRQPEGTPYGMGVTPYDKDALRRSVTNGLSVANRYFPRGSGDVLDLQYLRRVRDELRKMAKEAKGRRPKRREERQALGIGPPKRGMGLATHQAIGQLNLMQSARRAAVAARHARSSGHLELAEQYERRANRLAEAAGMEAFFGDKPRDATGKFRDTYPDKPGGRAVEREQIARTHLEDDERRRQMEQELRHETGGTVDGPPQTDPIPPQPEGGARPTMAATAA